MGDKTSISWTDRTYNRWWLCTKITDACKYCYAETLAKRVGRTKKGYVKGEPRQLSKSHNLKTLQKWDREAEKAGRMLMVFAHSMSDVFDEEVDDAWRVEEFEWMSQCRNLWFQLLTKRSHYPEYFLEKYPQFVDFFKSRVWLGTSIGSNKDIEMAFEIVRAPARLHWVSYEPAIGPLDVYALPKIDWLVVGGESGQSARGFEINWALDAFYKTRKKATHFFMKQTGKNAFLGGCKFLTPGDPSHGAEPADWPEELRVREFPVSFDLPRNVVI